MEARQNTGPENALNFFTTPRSQERANPACHMGVYEALAVQHLGVAAPAKDPSGPRPCSVMIMYVPVPALRHQNPSPSRLPAVSRIGLTPSHQRRWCGLITYITALGTGLLVCAHPGKSCCMSKSAVAGESAAF
jgi:hypothetical protein